MFQAIPGFSVGKFLLACLIFMVFAIFLYVFQMPEYRLDNKWKVLVSAIVGYLVVLSMSFIMAGFSWKVPLVCIFFIPLGPLMFALYKIITPVFEDIKKNMINKSK